MSGKEPKTPSLRELLRRNKANYRIHPRKWEIWWAVGLILLGGLEVMACIAEIGWRIMMDETLFAQLALFGLMAVMLTGITAVFGYQVLYLMQRRVVVLSGLTLGFLLIAFVLIVAER